MLSIDERLSQLRSAHWFHRRFIPLFCAAYLITVHFLGGPGPEHWLMVALLLFFSLTSDATRRLARVVFPYLLYAGVYDSMRWYADYIRSPVVHLHEPYDFDLRWFGIHTSTGVQTPNEWWQQHTSAALDFLCGLAYTPFFFIGESALLTLWFYLHGENRRAERFAWVFVLANFCGFSFYYFYPAAPPWYVAAHGFVADLGVRASPAGAARFDDLLGVPLMASFYGKSADVFGAIPSLHVVYPFLAMCYGWRLPRFRAPALAYWLLVCFAAVYLNHHYLIDIFIGLSVALVVMGAFRALFGALEPAAPQTLVTAPAES